MLLRWWQTPDYFGPRDGPVPKTPRAHLMAAAARNLSDTDILDLAAYLSKAD